MELLSNEAYLSAPEETAMKIRSQASLEPVPCYWGSKGTSALRSIPANNGAAFLSWNLQPSHLLLAGCAETARTCRLWSPPSRGCLYKQAMHSTLHDSRNLPHATVQ